VKRKITAASVGDEVATFRVPPEWRERCSSTETKTRGIFFHGSPEVNVAGFKAAANVTAGTFFTECPTYAACVVANRSGGMGGRIYIAELITQNPFWEDAREWIISITGDRQADADRCRQRRSDGFDAVVSIEFEGTIFEIIALDDNVVRRRDSDIKKLRDWRSPKAFEALMFLEVGGLAGPDYAPDSVALFGEPRAAAEAGGSWHRVVVDAINPIYCERDVWPLMDVDVLRYADVECLIDPRDGSALVLEPGKIIPLNRAMKRELKARARRGRAFACASPL
jgi:hypothetical protein